MLRKKDGFGGDDLFVRAWLPARPNRSAWAERFWRPSVAERKRLSPLRGPRSETIWRRNTLGKGGVLW